jgi:hypothetical protein
MVIGVDSHVKRHVIQLATAKSGQLDGLPVVQGKVVSSLHVHLRGGLDLKYWKLLISLDLQGNALQCRAEQAGFDCRADKKSSIVACEESQISEFAPCNSFLCRSSYLDGSSVPVETAALGVQPPSMPGRGFQH